MQSTTDGIKEQVRQQAQKQQQPTPEPQQPNNQTPPINVIAGAAKLFADKTQQSFNDGVIANWCMGLQEYIGEQLGALKPVEKDSSPNQVIEVFASSQIKSFGAGNIYYLSSTSTNSTSVSIPSVGSISNENGKGSASKN